MSRFLPYFSGGRDPCCPGTDLLVTIGPCVYLRHLPWSSQSLAAGLGLSGYSFHIDPSGLGHTQLLDATECEPTQASPSFSRSEHGHSLIDFSKLLHMVKFIYYQHLQQLTIHSVWWTWSQIGVLNMESDRCAASSLRESSELVTCYLNLGPRAHLEESRE